MLRVVFPTWRQLTELSQMTRIIFVLHNCTIVSVEFFSSLRNNNCTTQHSANHHDTQTAMIKLTITMSMRDSSIWANEYYIMHITCTFSGDWLAKGSCQMFSTPAPVMTMVLNMPSIVLHTQRLECTQQPIYFAPRRSASVAIVRWPPGVRYTWQRGCHKKIIRVISRLIAQACHVILILQIRSANGVARPFILSQECWDGARVRKYTHVVTLVGVSGVVCALQFKTEYLDCEPV